MGSKLPLIVALVVVIIAVLFYTADDDESVRASFNFNMAQGQNLSAFVLGATGAGNFIPVVLKCSYYFNQFVS